MRIYISILAVLYAVFLFWYGGSTTPLTDAEIQATADRMESRGDMTNTGRKVLTLLRSTPDNGKDFHMVNLIRFRDKAQYPADSPWANETDARAADARYSKLVVPMLLQRGSHPIYLATPNGRFIEDDNAKPWDTVAIVRYRSRRDILDMLSSDAMSDAAPHKFASIEATHVFMVEPHLDLSDLRIVLGLILLGAIGLPLFIRSRKSKS